MARVLSRYVLFRQHLTVSFCVMNTCIAPSGIGIFFYVVFWSVTALPGIRSNYFYSVIAMYFLCDVVILCRDIVATAYFLVIWF